MLNGLVEVFADGTSGHDGAQHGVGLHADVGFHIGHLVGGLIAFQHSSVARDEELGEVPFDVGLLVVFGILPAQHAVHHLAALVVEVESRESLLRLQEGVERVLVGSVHLDFVELWELDVKVGGAEFVNLLDASGGLCAELVAGEVENLEALGAIFLVERLQFLVLGCEAATGGGVDNEQHLALVVGQRDVFAGIVLHFDVVDTLCRCAQHTCNCQEAEGYQFFHVSLMFFNCVGIQFYKDKANHLNGKWFN